MMFSYELGLTRRALGRNFFFQLNVIVAETCAGFEGFLGMTLFIDLGV